MRLFLMLFLFITALAIGGCSKAELCESCDDDNDCADDLNCAQFEDGSWRCVDSPWATCETKSHVTAP